MSEDLGRGRVRRRRPLLLGAAALVVLLALPSLVRSSDVPPEEQLAVGRAVPLDGRLVYSTFEGGGLFDRRHRLWGFDLRTADLVPGPVVAPVEELFVVEPERGSVLMIATEGGIGVAYLLEDLEPGTLPREVARGDALALAADRASVLVGRVRRTAKGCHGAGYEIARVELTTLGETALGGGCGRLLGLASSRAGPLVSELRDGEPVIRSLDPDEVLLSGFVLVSGSPDGALLLSDPEGGAVRALGVWPETATGALFTWDGAGRPQPLVEGSRLFGERLVAWAPDGSAAVISGIVGEHRAMYLVRDGVRTTLLPPNSFPLRAAYSGASFVSGGVAIAASVGTIVVTSPTGVEPLELPPEAPFPLGPVVWLP